MNTAIRNNPSTGLPHTQEPTFERLRVSDHYITAELSDGRVVSVPLWWSWRLEQATEAQRNNNQIIGVGHTAYWPDVDEHLSVQGFLQGTPAPRPSAQRENQPR
jgi:hypothetical protein